MESFTVILKRYKTNKWSERYDADDKDAPVQNIYISKTAFDDEQRLPDMVKVTVEALE